MERIKEIDISKRLKRNADNIALVVGVLITIGSSVDNGQNEVLHTELQQLNQIRRELDLKYRVHLSCVSTGSSWPSTICNQVVEGVHLAEERERILKDYHQEYLKREAEIPVDEGAHNRGLRDAVGMLFGAVVAAASIGFRGRKFK